MSAATWRTRDGRELKIQDMTDRHLLNTISYLKRIAPSISARNIQVAERAACFFQGDMASFSMDQAAMQEEAHYGDPEYLFPEYSDLVEEAVRRGIL